MRPLHLIKQPPNRSTELIGIRRIKYSRNRWLSTLRTHGGNLAGAFAKSKV